MCRSNVVYWNHHRIELETRECFHLNIRPMPGYSDVLDQAFFFRFEERFHRATRAKHLVQVFERIQAVKLIQIKETGFCSFKGKQKFLVSLLLRSLERLARKENLATV